jgi:hypothetical protein
MIITGTVVIAGVLLVWYSDVIPDIAVVILNFIHAVLGS